MKLKDKLYIGGTFIVGSFMLPGCAEPNLPSYKIPETVVEDSYKNVKSNDLAKQVDEEIGRLSKYRGDVYDPSDRSEWEGYVNSAFEQVKKSNSIAIRSYFEHKNHLEKYNDVSATEKMWLDNRTHNLFYNKDKTLEKVLGNIDIDAFAQIVEKGDSLSIFTYNEDNIKLVEYRVHFGEGAEVQEIGGKATFGDRKLVVDVYEHNYNSLTGNTAPRKIKTDEKSVDIVENQTSLHDLIYK